MSESSVLQGIGVSPGVAYAPAMVVDWRFPDVPDRAIPADQADQEVARLWAAVAEVSAHLARLRERVMQRAGPEESQIFDAQSGVRVRRCASSSFGASV